MVLLTTGFLYAFIQTWNHPSPLSLSLSPLLSGSSEDLVVPTPSLISTSDATPRWILSTDLPRDLRNVPHPPHWARRQRIVDGRAHLQVIEDTRDPLPTFIDPFPDISPGEEYPSCWTYPFSLASLPNTPLPLARNPGQPPPISATGYVSPWLQSILDNRGHPISSDTEYWYPSGAIITRPVLDLRSGRGLRTLVTFKRRYPPFDHPRPLRDPLPLGTRTQVAIGADGKKYIVSLDF